MYRENYIVGVPWDTDCVHPPGVTTGTSYLETSLKSPNCME